MKMESNSIVEYEVGDTNQSRGILSIEPNNTHYTCV